MIEFGSGTSLNCGLMPSGVANLTTMTIMARFKPTTLQIHHSIVRVYDYPVTVTGWELYYIGTGATKYLRFYFPRATTTGDWIAAIDLGSDGKFHEVAVSYDASNVANDPVFYADGVALVTVESVAPVGAANNDSALNLWIGGLKNIVDLSNSIIGDVRICNRILAATEHANIAKGRRINCDGYGLKFSAPLDGGKGLQSFSGTALSSSNLLYDAVTGLALTPVGSPLGYADTELSGK